MKDILKLPYAVFTLGITPSGSFEPSDKNSVSTNLDMLTSMFSFVSRLKRIFSSFSII